MEIIFLLQTESANAPNWNIIIPSVFGGITTIILAYIAYKTAQAKTAADIAAQLGRESVEVSKANATVLQEVHTLSNGASERLGELSEAVGFAKGEKSATLEGEKKAADLLHTTENPLKVEVVNIPNGERKLEEKGN